MNLNLNGKTAVITGGTAGIGKASAWALAKEGCRVYVCGRNPERIAATNEEAKKHGLDITAIQTDVSDPDRLKGFIDKVGEAEQGIDILFNNAANGHMSYLSQLDLETWDNVLASNLTAPWLGIRYSLPYLKQRGGGSIISTSSLAARIPTTSIGVYGIAKSGLNTMTKMYASELAPFHIRVNAIAPGVILSEMAREGIVKQKGVACLCRTAAAQRMGTPEEVASAVVFLASDASAFITGEILDISGGKFIVQDPWAPWEDYHIEKPYSNIFS